MERVAVIVLNWNRMADTKRCVASLLAQTYKSYKIIIVDNGSSEKGTKSALETLEKDSRIQIVRNTTNHGFAGGVNTAIREIQHDDYTYVALFNNDAVADETWLKQLVIAAKDQKSDITTGLLLHMDGETIDSTGDFCSIWGLPFPRGRGNAAATAPKSGEVFSGSGGASLYSLAMLKKIGLFDETFFAYFEDTDLGFRAQLRGYKVHYTNKAVVHHARGATSDSIPGLATYSTFKNLPLLYIKNMPGLLFWRYLPRFILAYYLMLGNAIKRGNGGVALKGWVQSVRYSLTSALPARWHNQRQRTVSIVDIDQKLWHDLPPDQTGLRKFRKFFTGRI